jgi:hypothetical protein
MVIELEEDFGRRRPDISIRYDFVHDVLTVQGVRYAGELLRMFRVMRPGTVLEVIVRDDGVLTVREVERPDASPQID